MGCKLAPSSKLPKLLFKLASKNIWKRYSLIVFVKCVVEQVTAYLTTCGFSKHALGLQIYKEIL